ncbi:1-acyl-sn-glycerol-3-phosphate acyltransferase [Phormidium sp. LEGE 05292]|uniref:1-acyl-sn-glycerol-3-phosphate acyltransferase n=1 Tax=[Phormidium] sp. LEGE 05292 TaxID=767427 RepID=UPI0018825A1D|nr:1-acyl-sn-glycerol-3-phosphate acyltransferase [Phormidium sp. LEGE 05292]MBE9228425.1 1-acyl-sn-glycerol-3-phosphate acyltransferase [Phormidium sp. LEGE 05292]
MTNNIQVQPPLEFIPPNFNPLVFQGCELVLPLWLRSRTTIAEIKAENLETLVDLYQQFQSNKIRFLMAFRHPNVDDPYCLMYLLTKLLPKAAKQQGISLKKPTIAHFIYDRGIPLWAGSYIGWLYSQLGGTPIHRGKLDRAGLRSIRQLFVDGQFPMMASPEGATNGHNEIVSPIEPGIAQMGFWCVEDLLAAQRSEEVLLVPIGIKYYYIDPPWESLEKLLTQLEIDSGLSANSNVEFVPPDEVKFTSEREAILYKRLYRLGFHILELMDNFYSKFYHKTPSEIPSSSVNNPTEMLFLRLQALLDTALKVAEESFNIPTKGNVIDRCRRLEQAGWDWIYREDIKNLEALSPLEKGLADRIAEEASRRMWHMRLVESFVAVTGKYVYEKPSVERFAETTLLLWDMLTRIKGGNPFKRPKLGKQRVEMTIGNSLSVSSRWDAYKASRRKAVNDLTQDLQLALEKSIVKNP